MEIMVEMAAAIMAAAGEADKARMEVFGLMGVQQLAIAIFTL